MLLISVSGYGDLWRFCRQCLVEIWLISSVEYCHQPVVGDCCMLGNSPGDVEDVLVPGGGSLTLYVLNVSEGT